MCSNNCEPCVVPSEDRTYPRRCFITGEYCSMQMNIHKKRENLHKDKKINAFVVMNFSDMSDVVYEWKVKPFIESIKDYLYFDQKNKELYCSPKPMDKKDMPKDCFSVEINVVRSDTEPGSNYVVCNRICQQIQISDLVVIDVSTQNPNVFYEFGLAVSFGKLILPICYGESFYKREIPDDERLYRMRCKGEMDKFIGHYPWRKLLFEHFGIILKKDYNAKDDDKKDKYKLSTHYVEYKSATKSHLKFDDMKYSRFPYHEKINKNGKAVKPSETEYEKLITIGEQIYEKLRKTYNNATSKDNTLVVYTLEGFQNEDEVGRCIVNYHEKITKHLSVNKCFCGDRVGILVQQNLIPDSDKDAKKPLHLFYNLAEIIHIGMNDALYAAQLEKAKPLEYLSIRHWGIKYDKEHKNEEEKNIQQYLKEYVGNRGLIIYPENPIYVARLKNGLQDDILETIHNQTSNEFFCFCNVMANTLRDTHEIVVDISKNCIQSLFWLGVAHGLDINAITIMHEETPHEREIITGSSERKERSVFDVAGLWSAVFRSNDTKGFYEQLRKVQCSIEQRDKLIRINQKHEIDANDKASNDEENFESYYRNRFWKRMLRYNELYLYLCHHNESGKKQDDKSISVSKWDMDAIKILSRYLSRRSIIGEYQISSIAKKRRDAKASERCFISIGEYAKPLKPKVKGFSEGLDPEKYKTKCEGGKIKGFQTRKDDYFVSWIPTYPCAKCVDDKKRKGINESAYQRMKEDKIKDFYENVCYYADTHIELAQLRIWCEDEFIKVGNENKNKRYFRVELNGSSGPATYGLATLFVDDSLRETKTKNKNEEKDLHLLHRMQGKIRKQLVEKYSDKLEEKFFECFNNLSDEDKDKLKSDFLNNTNKYFDHIMYSIGMYLSTVFYRYFLPLLTEQDIQRICNGLQTYINTISKKNISLFDVENDTIDTKHKENEFMKKFKKEISLVLKNVLNDFVGIEAVYQVKVNIKPITKNSKKQDSRIFQNICEMKNIDAEDAIRCIFKDDIIPNG